MDLGKKIFELRKNNNITQEQLAKAVGVSTPAVCKWETGVSLPDISLLAPIARKLNTNLDDLLSFQENLSDTEVNKIMDEIKDMARHSGLNAGMTAGYEYLRKYPNADTLKLKVAMLPAMMAHTADEEYRDEEKYEKLMKDTTTLLEELTHSNDDTVRMTAIVCTVSRYMMEKRLEEAEVMLRKLPAQEYDARHLFPSLYRMKGEDENVFQSSQANMLQDIQHLLYDIREQHTIYLKNKEFDQALRCANDYLSLVQIAGTTAMCGNELLVNTYLAMGELNLAEQYFLDYIEEISKISGNYQDVFYYSHIADKVVVASSDIEDDMRTSLYKAIMLNESYKPLLESKKAAAKLAKLKQALSK